MITVINLVLDLLKIARQEGVRGVSIKIGTAFVPLTLPISEVIDQTLLISSEPDPRSTPSLELDMVWVIDATGSMADVIKAARNSAYNIASQFRGNRRLSLRIACVCYRDPVDKQLDLHQVHSFSDSLFELQEFLDNVPATGGGDDPEDFVGAINEILQLPWRPTAKRGIIWIADAPAHGRRYCGFRNHQEEERKLEPLIVQLTRLQVKFRGFSIGAGASMTFNEMKKVYRGANPGLFFEFSEFERGTGSIEERAQTVSTTVSGSLGPLGREFLADVPPAPSWLDRFQSFLSGGRNGKH
jgi:hypothetical protein